MALLLKDLIPRKLAEELGLWPLPPQALIVELATAGGPIRNYLIPESLEVQVVEPDKCSKVVKADAIISNIEDEVLVNDILSEELGIVLLGIASGEWRFIDDPPSKVRKSYPPRIWV